LGCFNTQNTPLLTLLVIRPPHLVWYKGKVSFILVGRA